MQISEKIRSCFPDNLPMVQYHSPRILIHLFCVALGIFLFSANLNFEFKTPAFDVIKAFFQMILLTLIMGAAHFKIFGKPPASKERTREALVIARSNYLDIALAVFLSTVLCVTLFQGILLNLFGVVMTAIIEAGLAILYLERPPSFFLPFIATALFKCYVAIAMGLNAVIVISIFMATIAETGAFLLYKLGLSDPNNPEKDFDDIF